MHRGFVVLHRKITEWEWYGDTNTFRLFVHLLLAANHKATKYQGHSIGRGELVVGRKKLSSILGLSEQSIRTSLDRLKNTGEITIKTTNKFSVVTVTNYGLYQDKDGKTTNKTTNQQPTTNQQLTTSKQYNNITKDKDSSTEINSVKPTRNINLVDDDLIAKLEQNEAYAGINIRREYGKMLAWIETPRGRGKQPTKARFISWLNRATPEDKKNNTGDPMDEIRERYKYNT